MMDANQQPPPPPANSSAAAGHEETKEEEPEDRTQPPPPPKPIKVTRALLVAFAREHLLRTQQFLSFLAMMPADDPLHTALQTALCAIKLPLSNFLFSADSACAAASSSAGTGMEAGHPDEPPTQARRRGEGEAQQRMPPQAFSPACALVFSAVNDTVMQRTLGFLPPLALAMTEQTSHFFRDMPTTLPPRRSCTRGGGRSFFIEAAAIANSESYLLLLLLLLLLAADADV